MSSRRKVRLLYQMTTAKQNTELGHGEVERRLAFCRACVGPDTDVDISVPAYGPGSIESRADAAAAVPALMDNVLKAEADGYDAVVISCFSDPGLDACRELVSIPVTASAQAAMHVASQLGARFSVLSPGKARSSKGIENPRKYGLWDSFASVRHTGLSVMDFARDREQTLDRLTSVGRLALEEDGADTLILGCMSMAFHGIDGELSERIGAPVVNPIPASLMMAELLVRCGLRQSRLAYPLVRAPVMLAKAS